MENTEIKNLIKKIIFKGEIVLKTGLHIGSTNASLDIGGIDNAVIRNPVDKKPYIPGSSLKGKMRALLSIAHNCVVPNPQNHKHIQYVDSNDLSKLLTRLFGNAKTDGKQRPSQLLVRDCYLTSDSEKILADTELLYTEVKTETVIDRITSKADPRPIERVPAGAKFNFEFVLNIFGEDEEEETNLKKALYEGMQLLQDDYLGGSGSRGSGKVSFILTEIHVRPISFYVSGENGNEIKENLSEFGVPADLLKD